MVARDPETGKFVSDGDGPSWRDTTRLSGIVNYTVPAADLGGGNNRTMVAGDESEIMDFTPFLENDEVFRMRSLEVAVSVGLPTTATQESSALISYQIGPDSDSNQMMNQSPTFYGGGLHEEDYIVDINSSSREVGGTLHIGQAYVEASHSDTVNALGGGGDAENQHHQLHFGDAGPVYDRDDELYCPTELHYDNISDHAIVASIWFLAHGEVEELD